MQARNTPTCVGKTLMIRLTLTTVRKHPHVRGEDRKRYPLLCTEQETPPRAWGRLESNRQRYVYERNTPTCVGKTRHA